MPDFESLFDRFLVNTNHHNLNEAEEFINEVRFMCRTFLESTPICLHKQISRDRQPVSHFRCKIRHRADDHGTAQMFNAMVGNDGYGKSLDVVTEDTGEDNCLIFVPDGFKISHFSATPDELNEASAIVDPRDLSQFCLSEQLSEMSTKTQHALITGVPFVYCIRI